MFSASCSALGASLPVPSAPHFWAMSSLIGAPPIIIFHGKADITVPYATSEVFAAKMKAAGNRCELVGYEGEGHGFFNYGRGNNRFFRETLIKTDEFLASLGYLTGPPQVEEFLKQ